MATSDTTTTEKPVRKKLSKLIVEGSKLTPKARGAYFHMKDGVLHTCAIGAAAFALCSDTERYELKTCHYFSARGMLTPAIGYNLGDKLIDLKSGEIPDYEGWHDVLDVVTHLNDNCGWSRVRIAALLRKHGL